MTQDKLFIAQVGRTVGLHGELKLHLHTDFPQQFQDGVTFDSSRGKLTINHYNHKKGTISFVGYASMEDAKKLTNAKIYSTKEQTKDLCELEEGEHFWFDIIGMSVYDGDLNLGVVADIDRMLDTDYLSIKTEKNLIQNGMPKEFLIPYIPRYILSVDESSQKIITKDTLQILEAS